MRVSVISVRGDESRREARGSGTLWMYIRASSSSTILKTGTPKTSTIDHGVALPLGAPLAASEVTCYYTCSLYHIVLHCLLTDNTATSHCRLDRLANEFFVQLSSKGARSFTQ